MMDTLEYVNDIHIGPALEDRYIELQEVEKERYEIHKEIY